VRLQRVRGKACWYREIPRNLSEERNRVILEMRERDLRGSKSFIARLC
jgi:hypothetical protein